MEIINKDEIDAFCWDHRDNGCVGVKGDLLDDEGLQLNVVWVDVVTGEKIDVKYGDMKSSNPNVPPEPSIPLSRLRELVDVVPTNWLDPLLTGDNKVIGEPTQYDCIDIERLLLAIRERLTDRIESLIKEAESE